MEGTVGSVVNQDNSNVKPYYPGVPITGVARPSFAGTFVVGGNPYVKGGGAVSVRTSAGSEVVHLGTEGITVNNGSITIKDLNGTNILDSQGIVSTTQFGNFSTWYKSDHPNITTTSYTDISLSIQNIIVLRASNVLVWMSSLGNVTSGVNEGSIQMVLGTQIFTPQMTYGATYRQNFIQNVGTVSAGTTVFKLQGLVTAGTNPMQFGGGYLATGYMVLGK